MRDRSRGSVLGDASDANTSTSHTMLASNAQPVAPPSLQARVQTTRVQTTSSGGPSLQTTSSAGGQVEDDAESDAITRALEHIEKQKELTRDMVLIQKRYNELQGEQVRAPTNLVVISHARFS